MTKSNGLKSWFARRHKAAPRQTAQMARRLAFRPCVETLEDRRLLTGGTISGHLLLDQTGNGRTADDTARSGGTVLLYRDSNHNNILDGGDSALAIRPSAADGSYSFSSLSADRYFVAESTSSSFVRTAPTLASYYTINLSSNQTVGGNDFADFQKCNPGAITNVSFTILHPDQSTATVTNLRGNTHSGDTVTANFTITGTAPVLVSLVTYAAPAATFDPNTASQQVIVDQNSQLLSPGAHSLIGHLPNSYYQVDFLCGPAIDHPGPIGSNIFYSSEGRLLSADNGGALPVIGMATLSGLVFADRDSNGVFSAGEGLAGFTVALLDGSGNAVLNGMGQPVTVTTGAGGAYTIPGIVAGAYQLHLTPPHPIPPSQGSPGSGAQNNGSGSTDLIFRITLGAADNGVNFNFKEPAIAG